MSRCSSAIISTSRRQTFFMNAMARSRSASDGAFGACALSRLVSGMSAGGTGREATGASAVIPPAVRGRATAATSSARRFAAAGVQSRFPAPRARRAPPCRTSRSHPRLSTQLAGARNRAGQIHPPCGGTNSGRCPPRRPGAGPEESLEASPEASPDPGPGHGPDRRTRPARQSERQGRLAPFHLVRGRQAHWGPAMRWLWKTPT